MSSSIVLALFVATLSIAVSNVFCWARLEAAVLLPHGSEALEPSLLPPNTPERAAAEEIAAAAARAGRWLSQTVNPDLIFLSTPHGITLERNFGIYIGKWASGSVSLSPEKGLLLSPENDEYHNNTIIRHLDPVEIAENRSIHIVHELGDMKHWNVEGIRTSPFDSNDVPLQYGSIIPLLMLPPPSRSKRSRYLANTTPTTTRSTTRRSLLHAPVGGEEEAEPQKERRRHHIFFSHPNRRHVEDSTDKMMSELLQLGYWFRTWMDQQPERIAVIISGDLSHTHLATGPYGYSPSAVPMDAALGRWASNPFRHDHDLLQVAKSLQPTALSCGFTGYLMLHGMLTNTTVVKNTTATTTTTIGADEDFDSTLFVNRNATYFGMMVATFRRKTSKSSLESS